MLKKLAKNTIEVVAIAAVINNPIVSGTLYYGTEAFNAGREIVGAIGKTTPAEKLKDKFRKGQ